MSLHTIGSSTNYEYPSLREAVPESFRSNRQARIIPCSLQTINLPAQSNGQLGSNSVIMLPCGASAGIMMNPYLRFSLAWTGTGTGGASWAFRGASGTTASANVALASMYTGGCATQCINRYVTLVNSQQIDTLQSANVLYDTLLAHSTSADWLAHDAQVMLGAGATYYLTAGAQTTSSTYCYVVPLLGLLGSQQCLPLYLINGTLQVSIDWVSTALAIYWGGIGSAGTDPAWTSALFSNIQLCYDRVQPEQAFCDSVRSDMLSGAKYIVGYTNYQVIPQSIASGGATITMNYGVNNSSLRGVLFVQYASAAYAYNTNTLATSNNLTSFQVSLDGRLINTITLDSTLNPALVFAEMQKAFGRVFDASITDPVTNIPPVVGYASSGNASCLAYVDNLFCAGVSCARCSEGLAWEGSPASTVTCQAILGATTNGLTSINTNGYFIYVSDMQLAIDSSGSVEVIR